MHRRSTSRINSRSRSPDGRSTTANAPRRNAAAISRHSSRCVLERFTTTVGGGSDRRERISSSLGPPSASESPDDADASSGRPRSTTAMWIGVDRITSAACLPHPARTENTPIGSSSLGSRSTHGSLCHPPYDSKRFSRPSGRPPWAQKAGVDGTFRTPKSKQRRCHRLLENSLSNTHSSDRIALISDKGRISMLAHSTSRLSTLGGRFESPAKSAGPGLQNRTRTSDSIGITHHPVGGITAPGLQSTDGSITLARYRLATPRVDISHAGGFPGRCRTGSRSCPRDQRHPRRASSILRV
jgi:hypothetical protein